MERSSSSSAGQLAADPADGEENNHHHEANGDRQRGSDRQRTEIVHHRVNVDQMQRNTGMFKRLNRDLTELLMAAERAIAIGSGMAVERFAVEHEIDMHDLDRRHQLIQLRFKLIERGGDEPVIQHGRHRLNAVFDLVLNAVIKLSEAPISVTKMVRLVSSVIKAENFVVNRIPVLTPRVNDYPMNHQAPCRRAPCRKH